MGIFATVYIFDTDVSKQMQTQARIESVYRKTKKSFFKFMGQSLVILVLQIFHAVKAYIAGP
ncbi:hypothetical protein ANCDUO_03137 [Ancylostoma duodenale]|uniref:Uncharacterized protein n=1 Tax=Ancylostoma duodenale TaxID=51022 RepID=A0A0C2GYF5_9BILA|nr:hypothetical protein ANCDUO_03137 [Ancylostoma duodenale]